jgi:hypothetical protein
MNGDQNTNWEKREIPIGRTDVEIDQRTGQMPWSRTDPETIAIRVTVIGGISGTSS